MKKIQLPISQKDILSLKAGDSVLLSGKILTGRDAAHKRFYDLLINGESLPVDIKGQVIYYVGPSPAKPPRKIGPAGPTSSYRMDKYTPLLLENGVKGMIGKGNRSKAVCDAIVKQKAVYFAAIGGAAALISSSIKECRELCYKDLGTESVCEYTIEDFPCIVAIDAYGNNIYEEAVKKFGTID